MKTDNSHLTEKIMIRQEIIDLIGKPKINVLELYAGKGVLWSELKKRNPQIEINVLQIEIEKGKNKRALCGDNLKFLPSMNLERFDLIDVDAYGIPIAQLDVIFSKKYHGFVCVTAIQSVMGILPDNLLRANGISSEIFSKIRLIFSQKGLQYIENYLYLSGVQQVRGYFLTSERKNYFYFKI